MKLHKKQSSITLYSRTYWDAEIEVPEECLTAGKGKVDTSVPLYFEIGNSLKFLHKVS